MRFYRVHVAAPDGASLGYSYFATRHEAIAAKRADLERVYEIEAIEIDCTRAGILEALNRYGDHADNG